MRTSSRAAVGLVACLLAASLLDREDQVPQGSPGSGPGAASERVQPVPAQEPALVQPPPADLLEASSGGDGDSWRDASGREYRLGLVNTPETHECFGSAATAERARLTAAGFFAEVYTTDTYGRSVAVVTLADGTNLNVHLARHGFADDKYLERFRHENPELGNALDAAFAAASAEGAGLWSACRPGGSTDTAPAAPAAPAAPEPASVSAQACHPDYLACLPVAGDGSGRGRTNDLDCGSIGPQVQLRATGVDPYRLDADGDGWGCQSS